MLYWKKFKIMWADHGDMVSMQHAGVAALVAVLMRAMVILPPTARGAVGGWEGAGRGRGRLPPTTVVLSP